MSARSYALIQRKPPTLPTLPVRRGTALSNHGNNKVVVFPVSLPWSNCICLQVKCVCVSANKIQLNNKTSHYVTTFRAIWIRLG